MTRDGNVRTEVGEDITVVVNSVGETRAHADEPGSASRMVTPLSVAGRAGRQLEWLEDIREFQGVATQLPQSRVIDGQQVHGWQLAVEGLDVVIWATEQGVPLEMSMNQGAHDARWCIRFEMNRAAGGRPVQHAGAGRL